MWSVRSESEQRFLINRRAKSGTKSFSLLPHITTHHGGRDWRQVLPLAPKESLTLLPTSNMWYRGLVQLLFRFVWMLLPFSTLPDMWNDPAPQETLCGVTEQQHPCFLGLCEHFLNKLGLWMLRRQIMAISKQHMAKQQELICRQQQEVYLCVFLKNPWAQSDEDGKYI